MSAIAGVYYPNGRLVERTHLVKMMDSLAHRGPDRVGIWHHNVVGLGQRLLWTTPESVGEFQPVVTPAGNLVLTADARIDNRDELIRALALPAELPDSALILAAYQKWGEQCPSKLIGDFAFVLWDGRRQILFCARDPMGVKPLYYYHSPGRIFAFASEIKALLCLPDVPRRLNETRVADYLARSFEDRAATFYQDILRLPAAHSLSVGRGQARLKAYWSLDPTREVRFASDEDYAAAFGEIFTEAVRCRLRSAFPVASTLSGGLDSSSIACTAGKLLAAGGKQRLHTLSAIFPGLPAEDLPKIDERRYIDAVLQAGEFDPHFVRADCLSPLTELDRVLWHQDEAITAPNLYMHWALYGAARQHGVRIFLDGFDGDTAVSHGLGYLAELSRTFRWPTLVAEAGALASRSNMPFSPRQIIWQYGFRPIIPNSVIRARRRLKNYSPVAAGGAVNPALARRVNLAERLQQSPGNGAGLATTARTEHWQSLTAALIPYTLELADKATAAFSLEGRYPFFDRRLIEFCLALPGHQKLSGGWTRAIMRRAMAGILPEEVRWRFSKANLSPNFRRRLLAGDRELLDRVIIREPHIIEPYLDIPALRAAYNRYASRPMHTEDDAQTVYSAVVLAFWLKKTGF